MNLNCPYLYSFQSKIIRQRIYTELYKKSLQALTAQHNMAVGRNPLLKLFKIETKLWLVFAFKTLHFGQHLNKNSSQWDYGIELSPLYQPNKNGPTIEQRRIIILLHNPISLNIHYNQEGVNFFSSMTPLDTDAIACGSETTKKL